MSQRPPVEFEDIEALRLQAGIDDAELRESVRALRAGDSVSLTARVGAQAFPGDRLLVRITRRRGGVFRGELARGPASRRSPLKPGALVTFRARHIHSVPAAPAAHSEGGQPAMTSKGRPAKAPAPTTQRRLEEIGEMLARVGAYAEFMRGAAGAAGASGEARARAVAAFHERVAALEAQLGRIHDEFRLG
jgi:hypothetical protein